MIPKFRAWDRIEKVMHYNVQDVYDGMCSTVQACCFGQFLEEEMKDKDLNDVPGTRRYQVMQYTGLFDKNKSELYDMDIVKFWNEAFDFPPRIAVITWDRTGKWIFDFGDINPIAASDIFHDLSSIGINELFCSMNIEKVGNIFENENSLTKRLKERYLSE